MNEIYWPHDKLPLPPGWIIDPDQPKGSHKHACIRLIPGGPRKDLPASSMLRKSASVIEERGSVYGDMRAHFERVARLKQAVSDCPDDGVRHVLEMICVKMARLVETPTHEDSWVDVAGYAACGFEITSGGR